MDGEGFDDWEAAADAGAFDDVWPPTRTPAAAAAQQAAPMVAPAPNLHELREDPLHNWRQTQPRIENPTGTTYQPQIKIMKRPTASDGDAGGGGTGGRLARAKHQHQQHQQQHQPSGGSARAKTIQEREAEYAAARKRIMGAAAGGGGKPSGGRATGDRGGRRGGRKKRGGGGRGAGGRGGSERVTVESSLAAGSTALAASDAPTQPFDRTIRRPQGPDGTRGFQGGGPRHG